MVDKEEYRRRIILTASKIFSHYGFRKTTMEEISRALKKGKSSIYYYFGSKEEIFEAVVLYEAKPASHKTHNGNQGGRIAHGQASQLYLRQDEGFCQALKLLQCRF
ncbi:MAG: TetR/AcrR family transcriptional regulator [Marinilabiliales bacterium]|nr:TetR/AcrR family transcriptional regulator [Marinilabiliales bacterium]